MYVRLLSNIFSHSVNTNQRKSHGNTLADDTISPQHHLAPPTLLPQPTECCNKIYSANNPIHLLVHMLHRSLLSSVFSQVHSSHSIHNNEHIRMYTYRPDRFLPSLMRRLYTAPYRFRINSYMSLFLRVFVCQPLLNVTILCQLKLCFKLSSSVMFGLYSLAVRCLPRQWPNVCHMIVWDITFKW